MAIVYKLSKAVSYAFGGLCGLCVFGFFGILGISSNRKPLIILTIALLPIGLVLVMLGLIFFPLSALFGGIAYQGLHITGVAQDAGISLVDRKRNSLRLLAWGDIKEFKRIFMPPGYTYQAVLQSGEIVAIDEVEDEELAVALNQRGIPFLGKDKNIFRYEV